MKVIFVFLLCRRCYSQDPKYFFFKPHFRRSIMGTTDHSGAPPTIWAPPTNQSHTHNRPIRGTSDLSVHHRPIRVTFDISAAPPTYQRHHLRPFRAPPACLEHHWPLKASSTSQGYHRPMRAPPTNQGTTDLLGRVSTGLTGAPSAFNLRKLNNRKLRRGTGQIMNGAVEVWGSSATNVIE